MDISVSYLGKKIDNPIVVASSNLTSTFEKVKKCEEAGAGAVVLKSLFEEQISSDVSENTSTEMEAMHPEAGEYLRGMGMRHNADSYLELIEQAKNNLSIPVFASLNCISDKWWTEYAKSIQSSGADGIELNISIMPNSKKDSPRHIEEKTVSIVNKITRKVDIPVAVKIGPYYTSLAQLAEEIYQAGAAGLVLFNRFYQPDVDIDDLSLVSRYQFSSSSENYNTLRWLGLLYENIDADLIATTGIHTGTDFIKQLLAGASSVQICSTLFLNGLERINELKINLQNWMENHNFNSVADFRGKASQKHSDKPEYYERLQYIKALVGIS